MASITKQQMTDANNLYKAYKASIKGSKWKESSQSYSMDFLKRLFLLQDELEEQTYKPSQESTFTLHERGKIRPITCIQPRDRIVRHVLCDDVLMPEIRRRLIYDNGSSIKGKGLDFTRDRFETHVHKYCTKTGSNEGYILFGDFSKFYDNVQHDIAKRQLLELYPEDAYLEWILDVIFDNFQIDVSYLSDEDYNHCMDTLFNKLEYRTIDKSLKTREKWMAKSINIGDQISQLIGVFYPSRIDSYVKTVRSQKFYGRYMDDFYIISQSKEELQDILGEIEKIANDLGIFINHKKTAIVKLSQPFTYLQLRYYVTSTGHITRKLGKKRVHSMRVKLKKMSQQEETKFDDAVTMFRSWMGSFYKLLPDNTRKEMLAYFEILYDCKITIRKVKHKYKMFFSQN